MISGQTTLYWITSEEAFPWLQWMVYPGVCTGLDRRAALQCSCQALVILPLFLGTEVTRGGPLNHLKIILKGHFLRAGV